MFDGENVAGIWKSGDTVWNKHGWPNMMWYFRGVSAFFWQKTYNRGNQGLWWHGWAISRYAAAEIASTSLIRDQARPLGGLGNNQYHCTFTAR